MKNTKFARMALVCLLAALILADARTACAETPQSDVDVTFEEGDEVVAPVDPDDPSKPLVPDGENPGTIPDQSGPLTLNFVSAISFGQRQISSVARTYGAKTLKPFVQVSDLRGTGAGWTLRAQAHEFTSAGEISLKGSSITFENAEAVSASTTLTEPSVTASVVLPTSGDVARVVVEAADGAGLGTWVTRWYPTEIGATENDSVKLTVLGGTATLDEHTAKISWMLVADVPEEPPA